MSISERDPASIPTEHITQVFEREGKGRHNWFGEYALNGATVLPELSTAYSEIQDYLHSKVIGQDQAIEAIMDALDRADVRMPDDNRPIASLAFLGPTGVGKTQTAKALSEALAGDDLHLVKIDCSAFSHGHEVSSLLGSPPGYVGQERTPVFAKQQIERSDGKTVVVLCDELEKGAVELHDIMLQIMDDGEITLLNNQKVSFRNAIVIVTSNLGAREMGRQAAGARTGFNAEARSTVDRGALESVAIREFKAHLRPEFVNRFNDLIVFHALNEEALHAVLDTKMKTMNRSYQDVYGARISLSHATRQYLVEQAAKEAEYGARPLVRAIEKDIASMFGRYIKHDSIAEGTEVRVFRREEVESELTERRVSPLVFTARPDSSIMKKPVYVPEPDVPTQEVKSTELVTVPNQAGADDNESDEPDDDGRGDS